MGGRLGRSLDPRDGRPGSGLHSDSGLIGTDLYRRRYKATAMGHPGRVPEKEPPLSERHPEDEAADGEDHRVHPPLPCPLHNRV